MHTAHDDSKLETMRFIFRHEAAQIYDAILPKAMTNQVMLDYVAYKTYYAIASGAEPPKSKKPKTKSNSAISFEETTSKKKPTKAKKYADRGKGLDVFSEVALSEAAQFKEATKQSKKDFHISQASGSGNGTDFESGVPDEQHRKTSGADEGTGTKLRVPDVPKYDSENNKESWGDSKEDDYDDDNNDDNNGDDNDANDDDNQENDDKNNDEEETNSFKLKEKIDDKENMDEEEADEVTKELYKDVNVNLGNKDAEITNADQGRADQQNNTDGTMKSSSISFDFTSKLLDLENPSLTDNDIAFLIETTVHHKERGSQTSSLYTIPITVVPEITFVFTITIPPPPLFLNPLSQQATPTSTLAVAETTTIFPALPDFTSVFKFNKRSPTWKKIFSDFKNPMIEKNVTESLDAAVLARSSSQPKSTYVAAASLSEFGLTKILIDKMEKNKSYDKANYKRELYDALVKSYQTDKDLFDTYGKVFTLKRSQDKDQDPSAGSDRGT
uniref:Uncharacterized protein n=1 Tax=Tanacetum cinerariifolium TaxID=118510 RepID=A0A6L2MJB6_TANCI|nr:hypothetical protein [Tanacetum cinerariifolium]